MQIQGLSSQTPRPGSTPEQIRKVAQEFESIFSSLMIKAMRSTVGENPLVPRSFGEDVYTDMLDNEYSKKLAANGSLGLADLIVKELERIGNPAAALKNLSGINGNPWATDPRFIRAASGTSAATPAPAADVKSNVDKWAPLIEEASALHGVDKNLIAAVIAAESNGNPRAVSPKGAKGLMQLMDTTAADMGVSAPFSPKANITGGTKYLKSLLDKFNGDEQLALASYNAGPAAVERYGTVPPYQETENYVASVMRLKNLFATEEK
jgi:soluble lytic murein transglycosylase-like protein